MNNPVVIVIGTRPGAIKSIPVYLELKKRKIPTLLLATFQHDTLLQQVLDIFNVIPDINLSVMKKGQDLFYLTSVILERMRNKFAEIQPKLVLVHGDTTTAFAAALAAYYLHIPIGHMEAGLRTGNVQAPFPEEMNRKFITTIANLHFAPTALNVANLLSEGVSRTSIYLTGNVVVDALFWIKNKIANGTISVNPKIIDVIKTCYQKQHKTILLTAHRRESFHNKGLERIFSTVKTFAQKHNDVFIIYPHHPNPNVIQAIEASSIKHLNNLYFSDPLPYTDLVYLLFNVNWVMTDSGGIQEEGISLGKKILILRDITERIEGVWEGLAFLAGTNPQNIYQTMTQLYNSHATHESSSNIYGDGTASKKIATVIQQILYEKKLSFTKQPNNLLTGQML